MRRTGGFRAMADFDAFGRTIEDEGFSVDVKPFGALKVLEVKSDSILVELYLREANAPEDEEAKTPNDEKLMEIVKVKYPYEGKPKMQFSC